MISLPSFFKNKSSTPVQAKVEPSFRSRQLKADLDKEDVLTENPEVQRARHRLIGAGFLLLIAVIGLPRLFDAQPKKINNDVVVKVVQSVTNNPGAANTTPDAEKVISSPSTDLNTPASSSKTETTEVASPPLPAQEKAKSTVDQGSTTNPIVKKGSLQTDPGEVIVNPQSLNTSKSLAKDAAKDTAKDTNNNKTDAKGAKYIVQIAALSSNDRVKNLTAKIKDLNITTYVLEKKRDAPDTTPIYLVRAGPFNSKEEAVNAEKKISALGMGLSPTIVEVNK